MNNTPFFNTIFQKFSEKTPNKQRKQPVWTATNSRLFIKHTTTLNKGNLSARTP
jgi:hypothetical protein